MVKYGSDVFFVKFTKDWTHKIVISLSEKLCIELNICKYYVLYMTVSIHPPSAMLHNKTKNYLPASKIEFTNKYSKRLSTKNQLNDKF